MRGEGGGGVQRERVTERERSKEAWGGGWGGLEEPGVHNNIAVKI